VSWIKRAARLVVSEDKGGELATSGAAWLNLILLLDVNAFVFSVERLARSREELKEIFHAVGLVDSLFAVARFRAGLPTWTAPKLDPAGEAFGAGLFHPAVAEPVGNRWSVPGGALLITGSNMAGKSTFLRTVGTSVVLAQTIATVPGDAYAAPILRVETLINREDDLAEGKSYFYAEAERVKEMLDRSKESEPCLFIIDELFRGTNTRERVSAANAVLQALNRSQHLCLVATHDLELLDLLSAHGWQNAHFQESVGPQGVLFDYRLKRGVAHAPNALKLLERLGYPETVLQVANHTYSEMQRVAPPFSNRS
jgi:DNA mismatch repair ATPase MutS